MTVLVDMRERGGDLYPVSVYAAVLKTHFISDADKVAANLRSIADEKYESVLEIEPTICRSRVRSYDSLGEDDYLYSPQHIIGKKLLEDLLIGRAPIHQPKVEYPTAIPPADKKHSHYFKDVSDLDEIDVYRVCDMFEISDNSGAVQHAIKKLLCAGKRGAKGYRKDLQEALDTIKRKLDMMAEDGE